MPVALDEGKIVRLKAELEKVNKDIASVERKKLITVVKPGGSDTVLYVQPLDLRGKDPEEDVEDIEFIVTDTDYSMGYANHKRVQRPSGKFHKRGPKGPFGWTYKINTDTQDGVREWEALKRTIEQHTSRHEKVPEPVPYHSDINELGLLDLKNISLSKEDVPTAVLEDYKPLKILLAQRDALMEQLGVEPPNQPENDEEAAIAKAAPSVFQCPDLECDFVAKNANGLRLHQSKHKSKEG